MLDNTEFFQRIFGKASGHLWTCSFPESPEDSPNWGGAEYRLGDLLTLPETNNNYFSIAELSQPRRIKDNFIRMAVLVLDDADPSALESSYIIETSPDNYQVGFILNDTPETRDQKYCDRALKKLIKHGLVHADKSGNSIVRYVRLPIGSNTKLRDTGSFQHVIHVWEPSRQYNFPDVLAVLGVSMIAELGSAENIGANNEKLDIRQAIKDILTGANFHDGLIRLAAHFVSKGVDAHDIEAMLFAHMDCSSAKMADPERWQARRAEIPRAVKTAFEKFGKTGHGDKAIDCRVKYRGVKPSVGAKRPKAVFWDKDKSFVRSPVGSRVLAIGKWSSHKTNFVALKAIDAIQEHGAKVLIAAGENSDEFLVDRVPAQCASRGITVDSLDNNLLVAEVCPRLTDPEEVTAFIDEHHDFAPNIVVIDTLSEAMTGTDENSAKDASIVMEQAGHIRKAFNAEVILVHHLGKTEGKGARGSSVFSAGADVIWKISYEQDRGIVTQYVEKIKRGKTKVSNLFGVKIFDDVMTVVRPNAFEAAAMKKTTEASARDIMSALKHQVIRAQYEAYKRDVMELESRQIAEYINRNAPLTDRERLIHNDMQKIQRAVKGTSKKAGALSDLVQLDTRGEPVNPYRFVLPERYREELEDQEEGEIDD